jgi:hypothetical protein
LRQFLIIWLILTPFALTLVGAPDELTFPGLGISVGIDFLLLLAAYWAIKIKHVNLFTEGVWYWTIAQFFIIPPSIAYVLSARYAASFPGGAVWLFCARAFVLVSSIYYGLLVAYFFRQNVRSLFLRKPMNILRLAGLGACLFFVGFLSYVSNIQEKRIQSPEVGAAEVWSGTLLPDWGEIGKAQKFPDTLPTVDIPNPSLQYRIQKIIWPRRGFGVAPFTAPKGKLKIVVFVPVSGAENKLEPMLEAIDRTLRRSGRSDLIEWSMNTIPGIGEWTALSPKITGSTMISLRTGPRPAHELEFPRLPRYRGQEIEIVKEDRPITVLGYQEGSFDEAAFKEFLDALIARQPSL